eukprot:gnl/TRDRNA2_/TRDRNA2_80192_c0_seq1.p1 gnl/TRDRNA2_/TRDRNA2_80192_c0~~gnl/TRDRNA2_/TRDRNA2_80192_c0_seq1.p1  ORF type:complete len:508 (-),score=131.19 gnl/TRDRNA2_/TRDRNA2_80192_c0_seq1:53-1576(-)
MFDFCCTQTGSRVFQACLKWGSREQREQLHKRLLEHLPKLALNRYGYMVVLKILTYCVGISGANRTPTEAEKKVQAKALREFCDKFRGKDLHAAFYHKFGCRVLNGVYHSEIVANKEKRRILHDIAVPQAVALMRKEIPGSLTLREFLKAKDLTEEQRSTCMSHLRECLEKVVDKELLEVDIVHILFQAFCESAGESALRDLAEKCMAGAPYLLSSKAGSEALLRLLGIANAKQRKAFLKDCKGKFQALAMNPVDYVVCIRLATTVDDTVILSKTMLAEWFKDLSPLCFDKYGHKVLAWLLQPADKRLFSPYECECVALPAPGSLKAPDARLRELTRALKKPLREVLLAEPLKAATDAHAKNLFAAYLTSDWDAEVVEALLVAAEAEAKSKGFELLGNGTAITSLLTILKIESGSTAAAEDATAGFALPFWRRCLSPRLPDAVVSRCSFVILELLKAKSTSAAVSEALQKQRKKIDAAVKEAEAKGEVVSGARKLLASADELLNGKK